MARIVGIDIGGTFTDGVVTDDDGNLQLFKAPSTPSAPQEGLFDCLRLAAESFDTTVDDLLSDVTKFTYGTTITTNLLVERDGTKTGILTTGGFGDTLPISRVGRHHLPADVRVERPDPLVPRSQIREIPERIGREGEVLRDLDETAVEVAATELIEDEGCEAIAIAFLWSFENPEHERQAAEHIRGNYAVDVTTSSEIAPFQGEYERTATAALNAYLRPRFRDHLLQLDEELSAHGYAHPLMVMQSTGGLLTATEAAERPISTLFSGPAGAITASQLIGEQVGNENIINIDMGGTSFDVSVITDGEYEIERTARAGGHTVLAPQIDIHSIGAGGGSIAWLDKNRLRVGPKSAGADPGPVCYDQGGEEPTVTDADLLLGYLNPEFFIGGRMDLNEGKAEAVLDERIATPLDMSVPEAAAGIRRIVDADMADAIRVLTVEKGYDPRDYTIVACGGAGPVHALTLADELGIGDVVVPTTASVHSALGILSSDVQYRLSTTSVMNLEQIDALNREFRDLADRAAATLDEQGVADEEIRYTYAVEMRFKGQTHELELEVPAYPLDDDAATTLRERFDAKYESLYGRGSIFEDARVEVVSVILEARADTEKPSFPAGELREDIATAARKEPRDAYFAGVDGYVETDVYDGDALLPGNEFAGPGIVERTGTTVVVPPGRAARVDRYENLHVGPRGDQ